MKSIPNWILSTFKSGTSIASARKATAFWMVVVLTTPIEYAWLIWASKHSDFTLLVSIVTVNLSFAGACLMLTTWQNIKKPLSAPDDGNSESSATDQTDAPKK